MNVQEAAKLLEVSPATVYALCSAGQLGHMRIGVGRGTIRITPEDIERYRADARQKGAEPPPRQPSLLRPLAGLRIPAPDPKTYVPRFVRKPTGA